MAPTICLSELPVHDNSSSYTKRRGQRSVDIKTGNGIMKEQQRMELKRIFNNSINTDRVTSLSPPASPVWQPTYPTSSFLSTRRSTSDTAVTSEPTINSANLNCSQRWEEILARREGLLDIVARTMALVRRSHMLQKRVNALRCETREFIRSVLNNPENNGGKQLLEFKARGISSSPYTEKTVSSSEVLLSRPITPPPTPDSSTTEYIVIDDNEQSDSNSSSSLDYSSDDSERTISSRNVTQDPMVSSS